MKEAGARTFSPFGPVFPGSPGGPYTIKTRITEGIYQTKGGLLLGRRRELGTLGPPRTSAVLCGCGVPGTPERSFLSCSPFSLPPLLSLLSTAFPGVPPL